MYPRNIRVENPQEALIVEQALAMYRELRQAAAGAADGEVLSVAEQLAMTRGRELTRQSLQAVLQEEAQSSEKRGLGPPMCLRRSSRASWRTKAVDPHCGRRADVASGVFCVSLLSLGRARSRPALGSPHGP